MLRTTLTFLLLGGAVFAQPADKLDALFAPLATGKTPGLAVMVRQNGKTIAQRAYGVRDLRSAQPNDPSTNFRLASFTKHTYSITRCWSRASCATPRRSNCSGSCTCHHPRHLLTPRVPDTRTLGLRKYPRHQIQDDIAPSCKSGDSEIRRRALGSGNSARAARPDRRQTSVCSDNFVAQRIFKPWACRIHQYRKGGNRRESRLFTRTRRHVRRNRPERPRHARRWRLIESPTTRQMGTMRCASPCSPKTR